MSQSNNRASLLSGLRTGGVRSASGPIVPHTAAPGGSFSIPRFASGSHPQAIYEDVNDGLDFSSQTLQFNGFNHYGAPMTAGFNDGRAPRFQQQQQAMQQQQFLRQAQLAAMGMNPIDQTQILQMQMMQAMAQQQQLQAQIALQQQAALNIAAQHQQQQAKANIAATRVPSTAGPTQTSFDVRSSAIAQLRSSRLAGIEDVEEHGPVPMTAALGGKFGSRSLPTGLNAGAASFKLPGEADFNAPPQTPSSTVVISGGTTIGGLSTPTPQTAATPSKSDSAVSWRRGSTAAPSTTGRLSPPKRLTTPPSPPKVSVSGPEEFRRATPPGAVASVPKYRPQPLRIAGNGSPAMAVEQESQADVPASPVSSNGSHSTAEAPKKYEGLGMGRPQVGAAANQGIARVSQPVRQPRGPPAGAEDLGSKNFATRIKGRASIAGPLVRPTSGFVVEAY